VTISPAGKPEKLDHALYYIRDGIVIIPKNALIPHGTVQKEIQAKRNSFWRLWTRQSGV
jgi:hypothetical protein